jgi:hypothetical protein
MKLRIALIASGLLIFLSCGCTAREELIAKSPTTPAGLDLSGQWMLRLADLETMKRIEDASVKAAGGMEKVVPEQRNQSGQSARSSNPGALVHVFLETGVRLKITQTVSAIFISFDRSVVEEYRFGEKRMVSVGPVEADRVSGWENDAYVIVTLDSDGTKMTDTYSLTENNRVLLRTIVISDGDKQQLLIEQLFDRV